MFSLKPRPGIRETRARAGRVPLLILSPETPEEHPGPAVLWIHGGGYFTGMKEMVRMSRAADLVTELGMTVVSPGYRLSLAAPYPAALDDCYAALLWMRDHAAELGADPDCLLVGGESAGGGLCASLCMLARDRGEVKIRLQMPLYPMLDNRDTESSRDNHGRVWNTRRNHFGWRTYLRGDAKKTVSPYAAAARQTDWGGLPPAVTFVGDGEPFYAETLAFVRNLKDAGIPAACDVWKADTHAFDMLHPEWEISRRASEAFLAHVQEFLGK